MHALTIATCYISGFIQHMISSPHLNNPIFQTTKVRLKDEIFVPSGSGKAMLRKVAHSVVPHSSSLYITKIPFQKTAALPISPRL